MNSFHFRFSSQTYEFIQFSDRQQKIPANQAPIITTFMLETKNYVIL